MSPARREKASVGQLGGVRCSLLLHRGDWPERHEIQGSSVCVCVDSKWKEQLCACVSLLQVALLHSHVRCVLRSAQSDPWQGHPFSLSCTGSFTVTPQVTALNLTTTALKESIKATTLSFSHKSMLMLAGSVQCISSLSKVSCFTCSLFDCCYTDIWTLEDHFA